MISALLAFPFLFVRWPPLTDLPGHMGRAAIAALAPVDARFAMFFDYHWYPVPNLGADIIVELLRGSIGIERAYFLVAALVPPLLAASLFALRRTLNPQGAALLPWALIFVYSYAYNFGFLNYMLSVGLSLCGLVGWIMLDDRPRLREALTWVAVPVAFLCHAIGGSMLALFIASREFARLTGPWTVAGWTALLGRLRPLLSAIVIIAVWRLSAQSVVGLNEIGLKQKLNALVMVLRDQNWLLDIGTAACAVALLIIGRVKGARMSPSVVPALMFLTALFVIMPSRLAGSHYADMRLVPVIAMVALVAQDWSLVPGRLPRIATVAGWLLLTVRLGMTTFGFMQYDVDYRRNLAALGHIPLYSRVVVLHERNCSARDNWRTERLSHLGELAALYRRSWSNGQWDWDGGHLLRVVHRPSSYFYQDPSQHVWPDHCLTPGTERRGMNYALARLPFSGMDYLWMVETRLPPDFADPRLMLIWHSGKSALYRVRRP